MTIVYEEALLSSGGTGSKTNNKRQTEETGGTNPQRPSCTWQQISFLLKSLKWAKCPFQYCYILLNSGASLRVLQSKPVMNSWRLFMMSLFSRKIRASYSFIFKVLHIIRLLVFKRDVCTLQGTHVKPYFKTFSPASQCYVTLRVQQGQCESAGAAGILGK